MYSDAITVFSSYPVVTAFLAWIILKEKITILHFVSLLLVILGVYLIAKGSTDPTNESVIIQSQFDIYFGYGLCVLASFISSFVFIFIRLATKKTPALLLIYSQGIFGLIVSIILCIVFQKFIWINQYTYTTIIVMLLFGVASLISQYTMTVSAQIIPAGIASLIRSLDSFWSYIWQILIFQFLPTYVTIIGAILVLLGVGIVSIQKVTDAFKKPHTSEHKPIMQSTNNIYKYDSISSQSI